MVGTIERRQTAEEKEDFTLLGTKTAYDSFNSTLSKVNLKYNKEFKPFDLPCARLDFKDKVEVAERESQRRNGFVEEDLSIDFGNLDKYGKADRFELIEDQVDKEQTLINGIRTHLVVGHTLSYRCKDRGHGISVSIPIDVYNEMFVDKKKGTEVKA